MSSTDQAYVRFFSGGELYALPLCEVREVIPPAALTEVPAAPQFALGVFNHHGRPIFLVDLCALLEEGPVQSPELCLLLDLADRRMALGVERIEGIGPLEQVGGVARHGELLVSLLSIDSLCAKVDLAFEREAVLESSSI